MRTKGTDVVVVTAKEPMSCRQKVTPRSWKKGRQESCFSCCCCCNQVPKLVKVGILQKKKGTFLKQKLDSVSISIRRSNCFHFFGRKAFKKWFFSSSPLFSFEVKLKKGSLTEIIKPIKVNDLIQALIAFCTCSCPYWSHFNWNVLNERFKWHRSKLHSFAK